MQVRWLVLGNWTFGWKTASKNSTASRGKVLFREHLACLNLATLTRFDSWIYPHLALLKHFCSLLGSHFQIWRTLWDRGGKALCTWPLQSKREASCQHTLWGTQSAGAKSSCERFFWIFPDFLRFFIQQYAMCKEWMKETCQGDLLLFKHSLRTSEVLFKGH